MKIGDKVRFLSEIGGGRVAGFQGKDIVLVEDEDGFQVPMRKTEVVVIGEENYDTQRVVEMKKKAKSDADPIEPEPADRPITFKAKPEERKGGEQLSAYLAFVPMDVKELMQTRFESYFVNDSNYYMRFVFLKVEDNNWRLVCSDEVEPNTKLFIEEFGREDLNDFERIGIQVIAYKRDKPFMLKPAIDLQLRIDTVKFYKLHAFTDNAFFEQPAIIYTLIEDDKPVRSMVVDIEKMKKEILNQ